MGATLGIITCLTALTSAAFAGPESTAPSQPTDHLPTYHLHSYYKLHDEFGIWQLSDDSPWQVVKSEPWIVHRWVQWGYVPITHDSKHYYCLIDDSPVTGTHIGAKTFVCGDPDTVQEIFNNNWTPKLLLGGGD